MIGDTAAEQNPLTPTSIEAISYGLIKGYLPARFIDASFLVSWVFFYYNPPVNTITNNKRTQNSLSTKREPVFLSIKLADSFNLAVFGSSRQFIAY